MEALSKLLREDRKAAASLGDAEVRFLVDSYYQMQEARIRSQNQVRSITEGEEPHVVLTWFAQQNDLLETQIKGALDVYTKKHMVGEWMRSITGIGPVIAAGMLSHIDITKAPTVGHIWSFAGLVDGVVWGKGQRRPWNAELKRLCCVPETIITTQTGPKMIKDISVGDMVLTHRGNWKRVTQVFGNRHDGLIHNLRVYGMGYRGPSLTGNHPVLARKHYLDTWTDGEGRSRFRTRLRSPRSTQIDDAAFSEIKLRLEQGEKGRHIADAVGVSEALVSKIKHGYERQPTQDVAEWVRADEVGPGHTVLSPTPRFSDISTYMTFKKFPRLHNPTAADIMEIDYDLARVVGLFIGDGHTSENRTVWSFGLHQSYLCNQVAQTLGSRFGINSHQEISPDGNMQVIRVGSKQLQTWFDENVGKYSHQKRIPDAFFTANQWVIKGLLQGLFESDGHLGVDTGVQYTTVNYQLALSVQQLLRMFGIHSSIYRGEQPYRFNHPSNISEGTCIYYKVQVSDVTGFYQRVMEMECPNISTYAVKEWDEIGSWHTATDSTSSQFSGWVYNLEVDDDHSYVADGVAVHNCWLLGESFVKVSSNDKDFYGKIYKERKELETKNNEQGAYAEQAKRILATKSIGKETDAYKSYIVGKLPPAHIHARAKRYAVKLFLSHLHHVWYIRVFNKEPPNPYPIAHMGHAHHILPPNL